jgi:hypothetical protein
MMPSRGMGAINPSKMPGKKEITRTDDPNKVAMYKRGGRVKKMAEGDVVEEEPTITQKISKQVAGMNRPAMPVEEKPPREASVKPTNVHLSKDFASIGTKFSSGDIPVGEKGVASFGADTSVSAAKGQRAKAMVDQLQADYRHELDKNTSLGTSFSASPRGEKRLMVALNKSFAEGGETGLYANINRKRKRIAAGSGEKMRKPGSKGAPTKQAFINSAKTAKK